MKKVLLCSFLLSWMIVLGSCSEPISQCSPACGNNQVCVKENGYQCFYKCTANEDCAKNKTGQDNLICHTDEPIQHCAAKE